MLTIAIDTHDQRYRSHALQHKAIGAVLLPRKAFAIFVRLAISHFGTVAKRQRDWCAHPDRIEAFTCNATEVGSDCPSNV